jgi:hypothetical protein
VRIPGRLSTATPQHRRHEGCHHFDVDTIDANEVQLGLSADLGGLTSAEARRVVADIDGVVEVVAPTIAE